MKKLAIKNSKKILATKVIFISTLLLSMESCKTKFHKDSDGGPATAGSVNFSSYVAVGSTVTAGFADNALYTEAQNDAYPNLIAGKIRDLNPGLVFNQPDINSLNGWSATTKGKSVLVTPSCPGPSIGGVAQDGESSILPYTGTKATLSNLAVPFLPTDSINVATIPGGTKSTNPYPYFTRITDPTTLGIASEARKRNATFFTIYLGDVDALKYATSGGTKTILSTAAFQQNIENLLDSLLSVPGSKGVIANVPYVDQFPIVTVNNRRLTSTTDPAKNPVRLSPAAAAIFNADLGTNLFSGATGAKSYYAITTGAGGIRQLDPNKDFVVTSSVLNKSGIGKVDSASVRSCTPDNSSRDSSGFKAPFPSSAVLDKAEIVILRAQIDAYNNAIATAVAARNTNGVRVAIVDLNSFFLKLTDPLYGIQYGTQEIIRTNHPALGPDFGGFFSLDRTNPTPKGQALLANEFIKAINSTFGASLKLYDPSGFRANTIQ